MPSLHRCAPVSTYVFIFAGLLTLGACQGDIDPEKAFRAGDYHVAHERWRLSAERGDPEAQNYLGILYQLGLDRPRDYNKAVEWYRKAALGGNADAQRNFGTMYHFGLGVAEDKAYAYSWYHSAFRLGNERARLYIRAMGNQLTPNQKLSARTQLKDELSSSNGGRLRSPFEPAVEKASCPSEDGTSSCPKYGM